MAAIRGALSNLSSSELLINNKTSSVNEEHLALKTTKIIYAKRLAGAPKNYFPLFYFSKLKCIQYKLRNIFLSSTSK